MDTPTLLAIGQAALKGVITALVVDSTVWMKSNGLPYNFAIAGKRALAGAIIGVATEYGIDVTTLVAATFGGVAVFKVQSDAANRQNPPEDD